MRYVAADRRLPAYLDADLRDRPGIRARNRWPVRL